MNVTYLLKVYTNDYSDSFIYKGFALEDEAVCVGEDLMDDGDIVDYDIIREYV